MDLFSKLREINILLITNDKWIRDSLSLFFEYEGSHFMALNTAEEAMEVLKIQDCDIIIVDYKLPDMDGLEFLKRIQDFHPDAKNIAILIRS